MSEENFLIDTDFEGKVEAENIPPDVQVETASAPLNLVPADPNAKGPWIEYTGIATVRILSAEDWKTLGIDSDLYCEWNYLNGNRLPKSMFNEEQLNYLLTQDDRFQLVEDESGSETTE